MSDLDAGGQFYKEVAGQHGVLLDQVRELAGGEEGAAGGLLVHGVPALAVEDISQDLLFIGRERHDESLLHEFFQEGQVVVLGAHLVVPGQVRGAGH